KESGLFALQPISQKEMIKCNKKKSWKIHTANQKRSLQARPAGPYGTVRGPVMKVVGTLDPKTNTITIEKMEAKSQRGNTQKSNKCSYCKSRDETPHKPQVRPLILEGFYKSNHKHLWFKCRA